MIQFKQECQNLTELQLKNTSDPIIINHNLILIIRSIPVLELSYNYVKSVATKTNKQILDDFNLKFLIEISKELQNGKFNFFPICHNCTSEFKKISKHPIIFANPRIEIVRKAIQLVISRIYEPGFHFLHKCQHINVAHSRLKQIRDQFNGTNWIVKRNVESFDVIIQKKLINMLNIRIRCKKTQTLIISRLKAGYINISEVTKYKVSQNFIHTKESNNLPEGKPLSILFCNIYIQELDRFIDILITSIDSNRRYKTHFQRAVVLTKTAKIKMSNSVTMIHPLHVLHAELRKDSFEEPMNIGFRRIRYVRYRNNFVVSVIGPKEMVIDIRNKIYNFLRNDMMLKLNDREKLIVNVNNDNIEFLGALIHISTKRDKKGSRKKQITTRITLDAPISIMVDKLRAQKFVKWKGNGIRACPTRIKQLVNREHKDIVKYYNLIRNKFIEYYTFRNNLNSLRYLIYLLHTSCARTMALKYKIRVISKVYKKFGRLITCPETGIELYKPSFPLRINKKFKAS